MDTRRSVVVVAIVGLFLAGCTDGDSGSESGSTLPDRTDSSSATASPTVPSASPTPTDPTAALEAEITVFFEEYIATVNESWTSEEALARRRQMFADSCQDCLAGYALAERAHSESLTLDAGPLVLHGVALSGGEGSNASFVASEQSPAGALRDQDGNPVQVFDQYDDLRVSVQVVKDEEGRWMIVRSAVL